MAISKVASLLFLIATLNVARSQVVSSAPQNIAGELGGRMSTSHSWGYAYLASIGNSLISIVLCSIMLGMIHKKRWQEYKLKKFVLTLFAFGIGGILGTTAVILLPKAYGVQVNKFSISGQEFYNTLFISTEINSLILLGSFGLFFLADLLARHSLSKPHEKAGRDAHQDSLRVDEPPKHNVVPNVVIGQNNAVNMGTGTVPTEQNVGTNPQGYNVLPHSDIIGNQNVVGQPQSYPQTAYGNPNANVGQNIATDHRGSTELDARDTSKPLSLSGSRKQTVLIILRQMIYNFASGWAIGTAFGTQSERIALSVSIAILIQEIPFEMADTILLYYSGLSKKNSILYNILWNIIPVAIGVSAARGIAETSLRGISYLFAAACGFFLYVAATNIMAAIVKERKMGTKLRYLIAAILGAGVMFAIFQIEE